MITYHKDFTGVTASIKDNKNGTATLTIYYNGIRTTKKYKNRKTAVAMWRRFCN